MKVIRPFMFGFLEPNWRQSNQTVIMFYFINGGSKLLKMVVTIIPSSDFSTLDFSPRLFWEV